MAKRIQTTRTFRSRDDAAKFQSWLLRNIADSDYGLPEFIDVRCGGGEGEWCVEFRCDASALRFLEGIATGIDL